MHAFFQVVHEIHVSVIIGVIDEREFKGGAGVAAVEDYEEGAVWWEAGNQVLM
jgi:hypothetical protein